MIDGVTEFATVDGAHPLTLTNPAEADTVRPGKATAPAGSGQWSWSRNASRSSEAAAASSSMK
ncbi:hypothetical protein [Actinoallomurus rhizosphaericola]|uniref:hypothetical protein n=1 Tax=Actinoallomurus rhizosphaericola TaxID=2952536 RepID=UPI002093A9F0|nr:hypothetical protein [Actinoallomurus rhizosphaericola]MCO5997895.1 hypothetical protein [Actinoallomurus rhizosphaericola]